jgi:hypothetical protein
VIGADAESLVKSALESAIAAVDGQKNHLVTSAVLRTAREKIIDKLPSRNDVIGRGVVKAEVDVSALFTEEETRLNALVGAADWDGLLTRYPLRESSAFGRVISGIKMADQATYRAAVLKLLQDDPAAVTELRNLLGGLYLDIMSQ